jgi:hypothetical protein
MSTDYHATLYNGKPTTEDWIQPTFTSRLFNTSQIIDNVQRNIGRNVKVKFTLEQAIKAQRGIRGIALLFL